MDYITEQERFEYVEHLMKEFPDSDPNGRNWQPEEHGESALNEICYNIDRCCSEFGIQYVVGCVLAWSESHNVDVSDWIDNAPGGPLSVGNLYNWIDWQPWAIQT